jgi:hypothetical protein
LNKVHALFSVKKKKSPTTHSKVFQKQLLILTKNIFQLSKFYFQIAEKCPLRNEVQEKEQFDATGLILFEAHFS